MTSGSTYSASLTTDALTSFCHRRNLYCDLRAEIGMDNRSWREKRFRLRVNMLKYVDRSSG